jgi:hypothetical protein
VKKNKFQKEHIPQYSEINYEVEKIEEKEGLTFYIVNGKEYSRNELLKQPK